MRDGNETIDATATESSPVSSSSTTTILAIDLGKFRSVACVFDAASGEHVFASFSASSRSVIERVNQRKSSQAR